MTRIRGRSPRGKRCNDTAPHGHWKTSTFIAALRCNMLDAPLVMDGPMDGTTFLSYVKEVLCPVLRPGDCVIADNLSSHKVSGVKEAVALVGATIIYLPPYSPDFNPIEKLFSKLKACLRKNANRTIDALWNDLGELINIFTPQECMNYFKSCDCNYV